MNFRALRALRDLRDFRAFRDLRAFGYFREFRVLRVLKVFMDLKFLALTIVNMSIKKVMLYIAIPHTRGQKHMMEKTLTTMHFTNGQGQEIIQFTFLSTMHQMTSFAFGASQYARSFQVESQLTTRQLKNCSFTRGSHNEDKVRIRKQRQ